MAITIDLGNPKRDLVEYPVSWPILMPEVSKKKGLFKRKETKPSSLPLVIVVDRVSYPRTLKCKRDELFVARYNNTDYYIVDKPLRVEMTSNEAPFSFLVNTKAVAECTNPTDVFNLCATISIYDGNRFYGDKITSDMLEGITPEHQIKLRIDLELRMPEIELEAFVDLLKFELQFSRSNPRVKLGQVRIKGKNMVGYVPRVSVDKQLKLYSDRNEIANALVLGDCHDEKGMVLVQDVLLDMSRLTNPRTPEADYEVECTGTWLSDTPGALRKPLPPYRTSFTLLRDNQGAALKVTVGNIEIDGQNNSGKRHQLKQVGFTLGGQLTKPYKLLLKNISSDDTTQNAGVLVKNLVMSTFARGVALSDSEGNNIDSKVMTLSGRPLAQLRSPEGLFLPNGIGSDSESTLNLTFDPTHIASMRWDNDDFYLFTVICNLEFDYIENRDGVDIASLDDQEKHFRATIEQQVYLEPNPEWLCVDYGSSATVAVYDGQLIDLHQQKKTLISHDPKYRILDHDSLESDSQFLSSDILLNDIADDNHGDESSLSSQQHHPDTYSNLAVCLSPTSKMIANYFSYQLPCLKMLVGRQLLPNNPNYNIRYFYKQDDTIAHTTAASLPANHPASLLSVTNIFREAYHELFRYFIVPATGDLDRINRLVLTYPNTYTPRHLSMIRDVVRRLFPSIRFDCNGLRFVSESDAVAAYYMHHWSEYHTPKASIDTNENILVYDMGAGTLDVSLLQKRSQNGTHQLQIVGKLGTCKAGNYLDFVIAKIICSIKELRLNPQIASVDDAPMLINQRIALKLAIKEQIKPKLGDESVDVIDFSINDTNYPISRSQIVEHPLFIQYIQDTTRGMLSRLCRYFDKELLHIDTVLMSGRSCRLPQLQQGLAAAVAEVNTQNNCSFIMLDNPVNAFDNGNKGRSKTAVAEGALTVADVYSRPTSPVTIRSKRLYANYGVAFKGIQDKWTYIELLNHKSIPTSNNDLEIQFPSVTVSGLSLASGIQLVQSYLGQDDTQKQLNSGDKDYITVIGTFRHGDYQSELQNGDQLPMSIVLTENDEVSLCLGDMRSIGQNPTDDSLESEVTQCSFWPVRVKF